MSTTWIVTTTTRISALVEAAQARGGEVVVVAAGVSGERFGQATRVIALEAGQDAPAEALAPAVADAVAAQPGDVVLAGATPSDRVLAAAVAVRLHAPILRGARAVESAAIETTRFGGQVDQTISLAAPVVVVMDGGADLVAEGAPADVENATVTPLSARVTAVSPAASRSANLAAAKRIVAVGRGFKSHEDLGLATDLADVLGAEMACSRPIAEGNDWLPRDRYIGVSGQHVAPEVYLALGISGQLQHTAGMTESKVVVAVNNDATAPIFKHADYGIVGDLYTVLPAITAALKA